MCKFCIRRAVIQPSLGQLVVRKGVKSVRQLRLGYVKSITQLTKGC